MAQHETRALAARVSQEKERSRWTHEALADVDSGRVVEHEAVVAWVRSLDADKPVAGVVSTLSLRGAARRGNPCRLTTDATEAS